MSERAPTFSVIICAGPYHDLLVRCVESMRVWPSAPQVEVVVVRSSAEAEKHFPGVEKPFVRTVYAPPPFGFSSFCNAGLREARGEILLLLNDDTELRNDIFSRLESYFSANPDCGVAGCKLLNPDGSVEYSCRRFPGFASAMFNRYSVFTRMFPGNPFSADYLMRDFDRNSDQDVDWVSGACLAIRRRAMEQVGLLDEDIRFFTEDVDYCLRMHQAGWRVCYLHGAEVMHHIGSSRKHRPFFAHRSRAASIFHFYRKHYSRDVALVDFAVGMMVLLRVLGSTAAECLRLPLRWWKGRVRA